MQNFALNYKTCVMHVDQCQILIATDEKMLQYLYTLTLAQKENIQKILQAN